MLLYEFVECPSCDAGRLKACTTPAGHARPAHSTRAAAAEATTLIELAPDVLAVVTPVGFRADKIPELRAAAVCYVRAFLGPHFVDE